MQIKRPLFRVDYAPLLPLSAAFLACCPLANAFANPQGGTVSAGSAAVQASGKTLDVYQHTDRAVIDWRSFNIDPDEQTRFHQPGRGSVILNRVHSPDPSRILGRLSANGNVHLVNPNGVFFGKTARVDVNGLLATTADIRTSDFMAGRLTYGTPGRPDASVVNDGRITAGQAGLVGLVAPTVANHGTITANLGKVSLASGDRFTMDLYGDQLLHVAVDQDLAAQLVSQTGTIEAAGGTIELSAAAGKTLVDSLIRADGELKAPTVRERHGKIIIAAEGSHAVTDNATALKGVKSGTSTVLVSGALDASGRKAGETGGRIAVLGDQVGILTGARLDASGDAGGGNVRIGGAYQGKDVIPTARRTVVQAQTEIAVNATGTGHGGRAIVWADEHTDFSGRIEAKGGARGGDGGFVETSGRETLSATGQVDAGAPAGTLGTWLLDPNNITINTTADTNVAGNPNFTTTNDNAVVTVNSIQTALNAGTSVSITTGAAGANTQSGDITVASSISKSAGGDATFTLKAHRNITFNAGIGISSTSGKLNMVFNADSEPNQDGAVTLNSGTFTTNGGNLTIGGGADPTTTPAYGSAASSGRGVVLSSSSVNAGGGDISIRGVGRTATASNAYGIQNAGATVQTSGSGNITLDGSAGGSGAGNNNFGVYVVIGGSYAVTNGTVTVQGTGGGGSGGIATGVYVTGGSSAIKATGSGEVRITGQAGTGSSGANTGVVVGGTGTVSTTSGALTVTGTGGGTGNSDMGVYVTSGGTISVTTGSLTVEGTGSPNGADGVHGIFVTTPGSAIKATAGGDVTVTGTSGGTGSNSAGVDVTASGSISNAGGALDITGTGSTTGLNGHAGVSLNSGSISVTGAGALSIDGTAGGSGAGNSNVGLNVTNSSTIAVEHGTATIQATGGGGTGGTNRGLYVSASTIQATGTGSLDLTAQATANTGTNAGVVLTAASTIATTSGFLSLTGTGAGTGNSCSGLYMDGASIISVVDGPLSVQGTASPNGADGNHGVHVTSVNTAIKALGAGALTVTGTGGGTGAGANNHGVLAASGGRLSSADGDLSVIGTGGSGNGGGHRGVYLAAGGMITSTSASDLTLTGTAGTGGASNTGIYADNTLANLIGGAGATGDITLITDSLDLLNGSVQTSGAITMHPLTAGTTLGIGGGAGTLSVADAELSLLNWGNNAWLTLGDGSTGLMTINTAVTFAKPVRFLTAAGADITLAGQLTSSATGAGMAAAVLLTSGDDFHNTFGATALNMTGGGRWLAYSVNPADDTIGSLSANFQRFTCTFGGACPAFPNTGNGFLYAVTPTLVFTPDALTIAYGDPVPALTYTATGYLGADAAADTLVGALTYDTPYSQGDELGTYDITYDNGALASSLGYAVTYADRLNGLTVGKRNITATVHDKTRHYGQLNPIMTWEDVAWTNLFGADTGAVLDTVVLTMPTATEDARVGTTHAIEITAFSDDHYHLTAYTPGTLSILGSPDGTVVPVTPDQTPTGDDPAGGSPDTGGNPVGGTPGTGGTAGTTSHGRPPTPATDRIPDTFKRVSQDPTEGLASGEMLALPALLEKPSDDEPKPTAILGRLLRIHPALIRLLGLDPTHL